MSIVSDELNKLAIVSKLKTDDIKKWGSSVLKEVEKWAHDFTEDYTSRINEVNNIYEKHNEPVKEVKRKLEALDELIAMPATPETLIKMESKDRDFKKNVVKQSELLSEYMHNKKSKKAPSNS